MLKDLFINAMEKFDKECLLVEGTLGDFVIEDFNVCVDKNFITIKGFEWDKFTEGRTGYIKELKINCNQLTDYENYSNDFDSFVAIGINNGEHYAEFSN